MARSEDAPLEGRTARFWTVRRNGWECKVNGGCDRRNDVLKCHGDRYSKGAPKRNGISTNKMKNVMMYCERERDAREGWQAVPSCTTRPPFVGIQWHPINGSLTTLPKY